MWSVQYASPEISSLAIANCPAQKKATCWRFSMLELTEWRWPRTTIRVPGPLKFWFEESRQRLSGAGKLLGNCFLLSCERNQRGSLNLSLAPLQLRSQHVKKIMIRTEQADTVFGPSAADPVAIAKFQARLAVQAEVRYFFVAAQQNLNHD